MADNVVIVESAAKAKTIGKYLGKNFEVKASRGHIRDLPENDFGVDVEQNFEPTYRVMPGSRRIVGQLRKLTKGAQTVYLAPDPDREGEAIAWHLQHVLDVPGERIKRVTFNEITSSAVREAFQHPRDIDVNLVNAQQARRILDRIVGYELSPLISKKVVRGLSAGRVQSVALRMVVDRERERIAFVPEEYWQVIAVLRHGEDAKFEAELKKMDGKSLKLGSEEQTKEALGRVKDAEYTVTDIKRRATKSSAPPPFITSTMQQAANNELRFGTSQTMRVAQQLYEGMEIGSETVGLITYMRTDSTRVAESALERVRGYIGEELGAKYLPAKPNRFRSPKGAQAAHEAIRPTDVRRTPSQMRKYLDDRQYKLYDLVWRRFVASQMVPARYDVTVVDIQAGPALFIARGRVMTFDGYTRMTSRGDVKEQDLPNLETGDALDLVELNPSQHFTQPPPRFSEASLVKELEKQGIGRPSTYAPTIRTLLSRNYVKRERRSLRPSDLGMVVTDLLVEHFPRELDFGFTSHLEEELDEVEEGKRDWRETLREFYSQFESDLERARDEMEAVKRQEPEEQVLCENCGKPMVIMFSRKGDKFLGCSGFPECRTTRNIPREGEPEAVETEHKCDKCGAPMLLRTGRRGREYLACSAFPECRNIMGLDKEGKPVQLESRMRTGMSCPRCGQEMHIAEDEDAAEMKCSRCRNTVPLMNVADALEKTEFDEQDPPIVCDECGKPMAVKRSRKGMFLGCTGYPECKHTAQLGKETLPDPVPTFERCEKCGRPLAMRWGQYGRFLACTGFPRCRNLWQITGRRRKCKAEGCGARLMKKIDKDGNPYLGCTRYPECEYTEPLPAEDAEKESAKGKKKSSAKKSTAKKSTRKKSTKKSTRKKSTRKKRT